MNKLLLLLFLIPTSLFSQTDYKIVGMRHSVKDIDGIVSSNNYNTVKPNVDNLTISYQDKFVYFKRNHKRVGLIFEFYKTVNEDNVEKQYYYSNVGEMLILVKSIKRISYWNGLVKNNKKYFTHYFYE